jgi:hypothetical protein
VSIVNAAGTVDGSLLSIAIIMGIMGPGNVFEVLSRSWHRMAALALLGCLVVHDPEYSERDDQ